MANNKKVFQIQINGVTEATKSVDALYGKILDLQKAINSMKKVDIPISIGNGKKDIVDEIARLKKELNSLKETAKDIDLGSEEYAQASEKVNQLTKDFTKLDSSIKKRNIENLKDTLKDATKEADNLSESVDDVKKKFDSIKGIRLDENSVKRYGLSIGDLKWQISQLEKAIEGMEIGSDKWQATNRELLDLKQTLAQVQKQMEAAVRAEDQLNTKIRLNINGMSLSFDDVNQAIGVLEDKLYALSAAGQSNTKEFSNIQAEIVRLRKEVIRTDAEIDSMATSFGGFDKVFGKFRGVTSLFAMGEGFTSLFGDNQQLTESIQKMTSLMVILESMKEVSEEMAKQSSMGKFFTSIINGIDNIAKKIPGVTSLFGKWSQEVSDLNLKIQEFDKAKEFLNSFGEEITKASDEISKIGGGNVDELIDKFKEFATIKLSDPFGENLTGQQEALNKYQKELDNLYVTGKLTDKQYQDIQEVFLNFNDALNNTSNSLVRVKGNLDAARNSASKTTKVIQGLSLAFKTLGRAIGIGLLIEAISFLIDGITKLVSKLGDWVLGNDKLVNSNDSLQQSIDAVNKQLDNYNKQLDKLVDNKVIDNVTKLALSMTNYESTIKKVTKSLQDLIDKRKEYQTLEEGSAKDGNRYTWFGSASDVAEIEDAEKRVKEFEKTYLELLKAVQTGKDEAGGNWWFTASDARSDLAEMQKIVVNDIQNMFANIDLTKTGDALRDELKTVFDKLDTEMYSTAFANIENLFPEQEWAKVLKARVDQVRDMYEQLGDLDNQYGQEQIALAKRIRNNYTSAIADETERARKELENSYKDEIEAAANNKEEIASINAKYARLRVDQEKQLNDQLKNEAEALNSVLRQIRDNQLSIEEESLAKRIKALENAKNDEIQAAKDGGIKVGELTLSIEQKYNKLIEKERKNHLDYLNELAEDYARKQQELQQSLKEDELNNQSRTIDINYNTNVNSSSGSFDFNAQYGDRIQAEKELSQQRLDIELQYLQEKLRLDKEYAKLESEGNTNEETNRYNDRLKELKSYHEEGKLSLDEYNSYVEKENELHSQKLQQIQQQLTNNLSSLDNEYNNESKSITSRTLTENANLYSEYTRKVMDIMSGIGQNRNMFGILSYSETKKQMDEALKAVTDGVNAIDNEIIDLTNKLNNNEITFVDYKDARQQLEDTKKELESQGKDITASMSDLFSQVAGGWKSVFDGFVSQISSLLSTLNDTQLTMIDNQLAEIEHQLEIQEEAYEKAEEAAQSHKDKMDSIEDELADARGSRRQFLIDTLASQQAAYLEDVAAQQKAEAEKEKLEKKQQALEKKRQEQEKKSKVQQAIINTYMAVSNALAVPPWFVGLALSAVALALGMKNVAAIKSTPIYEDGGVIQGKSHSQGGVKVLGGQAEVEGGEFITNRKSTAKNLPLLTYINDKKREVTPQELMEFFSNGTPKMKSKSTRIFADGGLLPTTDGSEVNRIISVADTTEDNSTYVVQVVDIVNATENLKKVQTLSGLVNE